MTSNRELLLTAEIPNLITVGTNFARRAEHQVGCNTLQEQVRINLGSTNTPSSFSTSRAVGI